MATDWMREVFEPTVRMIPREYRSQIEPAQFFHEVLDHRWFLAEKAGHDVPMGEAVTSYIDNALPSYSLDSKALAELNEEPIPASLTTNPPTATRTTTATTPMTIRMRQCGVIKRTIRWTVCR